MGYKYAENIILIDSTYKKNHNKLPIFVILSCDEFFFTFPLIISFFADETLESFIWVFTIYLESHFPVPRVIIADEHKV